MAGNEHPAGWYPDPLHRADWRYWDGEAWNARVADRQQRTWVDEVFVEESRARAAAAGVPEPTIAPPPGPRPAPEVPAAAVAAAVETPTPRTAPTPRVRSHRVRHAIASVRRRIAADLAVHWLAYIGVVLIFVGVFGFMVFSFRDVGRNWRPVAEVMIPLTLAGAAWYLRRQRAPFVATLVAGLAGALLPIAAITAFNDDFSFPPDLSGAPRPLLSGAICLLIGAAYAWWTTRRPETPLRFLAGPAAWLGVGVAVGVFADRIPVGTDVARADAWQSTAMVLAIAGSLLIARWWRPDAALSRATVTAAFPGFVIATAFGLSALVADGGWYGAGTVGALGLLVVFDLLAPRLRPVATGILEALAVVGAVLTLHPPMAIAWQFAVIAVALLGLTEWTARRRTPDWLLQVLTGLALASLVGTVRAPWATVAASGLAALWAHARRYAPPRWLGPDGVVIGALAALLPLAFAGGLLGAVSLGVAMVTLAAIVTVVAATVRLARRTDDPYWRWWIPVAVGSVEFGIVLAAFAPLDPMYAWLAGASALVTATAAIMPVSIGWRRATVAASVIWTGWLTAMAFDLGGTVPAVRTLGLAILTVLLGLGARRVEDRYRAATAGVAAASGLGTLASLGDWLAWDRAAWTVGFAAAAGAIAVTVVGATILVGARRALLWPWAAVAMVLLGSAVAEVIDRPVRVGEGVPGLATAAAAGLVALGAFLLVRRWNLPALVEVGVAALVAAGTSLAIGTAATPAGVALGAVGATVLATGWAIGIGTVPAPGGPDRVSSAQRGGLEVATLAALVAVAAAPETGDLGWISPLAWFVAGTAAAAIARRWRAPRVVAVSAIALAGTVAALGVWRAWAPTTWLMVGSVAAASVVLVATGTALLTRVARAWLAPWVLVGLAASATAVVAAVIDVDGATRGGPGYVVAAATLAVAVVGVLAEVWGSARWRTVAAVWVGLAAYVGVLAADLGAVGVTRAAAIAAIALTVLVAATWRVGRLVAWHRIGTALATVALALAVMGTVVVADRTDAWSDVASLVTLALFACGVEAWTFGTLWDRPTLAESAPFWLVGAWCAFAAGSLSGNAQWYTVPIGVAIIGVEEIRRADHRHAGEPPYSVSGRWIEYLGMMLIVAASMFQTVLVSPYYAFLGVVLGMSLATWGALTHVRRRAVFGTASTALAIVLLLGEYLVDVVPMRAGVGLWISLAALGVVAIAGAAFLERGRHAWRAGVQRFGSVTHDWE